MYGIHGVLVLAALCSVSAIFIEDSRATEEGESRLRRQIGRYGAVVRSTTYTTSTVTSTYSTVSLCACKAYSCVVTGAKRRKRDLSYQPVRSGAASNYKDFYVSELEDDEFGNIVKRSIKDTGLNIQDTERLVFMPTRVQKEERLPRNDGKQIEDSIMLDPVDNTIEDGEVLERNKRFLGRLITLRATREITTTTTTTTTVGTVGITGSPGAGTTQTYCATDSSITHYVGVCGGGC